MRSSRTVRVSSRYAANAGLGYAVLFAALATVAPGQPRTFDPATDTITHSQPLMEAAKLMEWRYGTPVTYEDPVWARNVVHAFTIPAGLTPADNPKLTAALLRTVVSAYHSQNPGQPRFRVIESRLGLHIAPVSVPGATGAQVPAVSLLDSRIGVPSASRTAAEHIDAVCAAVEVVTGVAFTYRRNPNSLELFDRAFAANGYAVPGAGGGISSVNAVLPTFEQARPRMLFTWGTRETTAREALLDILDRSATTMKWELICPMIGGFPCNIWFQGPYRSGPSILFDRLPVTIQ